MISLDLGGPSGITRLDVDSQTATVLAGTQGPELEQQLGAQGLTLGHFPQSFEYISIGGAVATRSAGQASTGMGRIDKLVLGLRCVTPTGVIDLGPRPSTAAGPDVREYLIGSEGTLGVITDVTLRFRSAPETDRYEAFLVPSFAAGAAVFRELVQSGAAPDVARLSDAAETSFSMLMSGSLTGPQGVLVRRYLGLDGAGGGCVVILGWQGPPSTVDLRRTAAAAGVKSVDGAELEVEAGRAWAMAETLETATTRTAASTVRTSATICLIGGRHGRTCCVFTRRSDKRY